MSQSLQARDRFSFRVSLHPDALWERILAHPRIRAAQHPAPDPPPPEGAPFLVARPTPHELRLRHWAGPADAVSPVVIMRLGHDEHGGTVVRGHFERRRQQDRLVELPRLRRGGPALVVAAVAITVLSLALIAPVLIGSTANIVVAILILLFFFTIPTALVFVPGLLIWNAEGRKRFTASLWELMGELMTPIALPRSTSDRPFRGHALPTAEPDDDPHGPDDAPDPAI
ncbi:MAG: hypothetical protein AAGF11_37710 [Myxococcota bacterium]